MHKILLVDDEPQILESISRRLGRDYRLITAEGGAEGLRLLQEQGPFAVVIADMKMPVMDGIQFLEQAKEISPDTVQLILTGAADLEDTITAVNTGNLFRFLTKPCPKEDLILAIDSALEHYMLRIAKQELEVAKRLQAGMEETLFAFSSLIETRDPYTAGHMRAVAKLSQAIAAQVNMDLNASRGLYLAAMVHDIGKISIPAEILNKPGKLSSAEFEIIKTHVLIGSDVLGEIKYPWPIARIIREHHERIDGSGYPFRLRNDELLLESKVLAVADMADAIQAHRPYRPGLGVDVSIEELQKERGKSLDPEVVDACVAVLEAGFYEE